MSFVPDPNPGPRILPKVFADVPSANELADARADAAAVRSSRNMLVLVLVLLLGMLITAGVAIVYFENLNSQLAPTIEALETERDELKADVVELNKDLDAAAADKEAALKEFDRLQELLAKNAGLREDIREVIEDKPTAVSVRKPALDTNDDITALKRDGWLEIRDVAETALEEESTELQAILKDVTDHRPPRRRTVVDPR